MKYKYSPLIKWISVITDFLLLNLALYFSFLIENQGASLWSGEYENYRVHFLLINLYWFYCSSIVKLYDNMMLKEIFPMVKATIITLVMFVIAPFAITVLLPNSSLSITFVINSFVMLSSLLLLSRATFLSIRKIRHKFWAEHKKVVIIGAGPGGKKLYSYFNTNLHLGYQVAGFFDDELSEDLDENTPTLGKVKDCLEYAKVNGITEVFCTLSGKELKKVKLLLQEAEKQMIRLRLVPDLNDFFDKNVLLDVHGHMPILVPRNEPLENKANEVMKRAFDFVFSLLVIVFLLSWLIPLIGIILKCDSKGPIFFKQLRSGKDNNAFYCYKFRSMTVNSDSDSKQATKGDARITRVGAFLRKTSLDELPQFFNVLKGEMSVVGPRPHMLKHTEDYSLLINNFMVRHYLTPGITGWAQVSGYRGETKETSEMANRIEADIWYLENWSLILDLKIIFRTVWQAVRGSENAF